MSLSVQGTLTQGTNQQNIISAGNQATFTYIVQNSGPDLANNITLIDNLSSAVTGVPLTFVSASVSSGTCGGGSTNAIVSCSLPSLQAGSTATVTIVVTPNGTATGNSQSFNGGAVQLMAPGNIVLGADIGGSDDGGLQHDASARSPSPSPRPDSPRITRLRWHRIPFTRPA